MDTSTELKTALNTPTPEAIILAPTPTPTPNNYNLLCYPVNGSDIKAGFYCITPTDTTTQNLIFDYKGEQWQTQFSNKWTSEGVVIASLLFFLTLATIINIIFSMVFRSRVQIYKKIDK